MGNSVYISKNLSLRQIEFLNLLDQYEIDIFRFHEIENKLNQKFSNINEILENLVLKGFLIRIEREKFIRSNFKDTHVIGTFLIQNSAIAYWSALNLHGLTEQFSNTTFIQSTKRKNDKVILGVYYKFVKISEKKTIGITYNGYGNYKYAITDVEKTLLDCFDQPRYCGGYDQLIRALFDAKINSQKMINYSNKIGNKSIIKRIGFLCELFNLSFMKKFIDFAKNQINSRYDLIDPNGSQKGEFISNWKLRLNISKEELKRIIQKTY